MTFRSGFRPAKAIFAGLMLASLSISSPAADFQVPADAAKGAKVEGFAKFLGTAVNYAPVKGLQDEATMLIYQTYRGDQRICRMVRQEDGKGTVQWESAPLPAQVPADGASLAFAVGLGSPAKVKPGGFHLWLDGKEILTFDYADKDQTWASADKLFSLRFIPAAKVSADIFGVMVLQAPADALKGGAPAALKVTPSANGVNAWFMLAPIDDVWAGKPFQFEDRYGEDGKPRCEGMVGRLVHASNQFTETKDKHVDTIKEGDWRQDLWEQFDRRGRFPASGIDFSPERKPFPLRRTVFRDTKYGTESWRMTDFPGSCAANNVSPSFNCDGSMMLISTLPNLRTDSGAMVLDLARGTSRVIPGGAWVWSTRRPTILYGRQNKVVSLDVADGKMTDLVTEDIGNYSLCNVSFDDRYLLLMLGGQDVAKEVGMVRTDGSGMTRLDVGKGLFYGMHFTHFIGPHPAGGYLLYVGPEAEPGTPWLFRIYEKDGKVVYDKLPDTTVPSIGHCGWTLDGQSMLNHGTVVRYPADWSGTRAAVWGISPTYYLWEGYGWYGQPVTDLDWNYHIYGSEDYADTPLSDLPMNWPASWKKPRSGLFFSEVFRVRTDGSGNIQRIAYRGCNTWTKTLPTHQNTGQGGCLEGYTEICPSFFGSPDNTKMVYTSSLFNHLDRFIAVVMHPTAPSGLAVKAADKAGGEDRLTWTPPAMHRETAGYHVYRAKQSGGPYVRLTGAPVADASFAAKVTAEEAAAPRYYVVTSQERCGLESRRPSAEACSDGAWPGAIRLRLQAEDARLEGDPWMVGRDPDCGAEQYLYRWGDHAGSARLEVNIPRQAKYRLWLRVGGLKASSNNFLLPKDEKNAQGPYQLSLQLDKADAQELKFDGQDWTWVSLPQDTELTAGRRELTFTCPREGFKIDEILLTSEAADKPAVGPWGLDSEPPAKAGKPEAVKVNPFEAQIKWAPSASADVDHYNVYSFANPEQTAKELGQRHLVGSPYGPEFLDYGLASGRRYVYAVTAVDRAGNESAASEPLTIETPKIEIEKLEAEAESLKTSAGGFTAVQSAKASGGAFAKVDFGKDTKDIEFVWPIKVAKGGEYNFLFRGESPEAGKLAGASVFVSVDGKNVATHYNFMFANGRPDHFYWQRANTGFDCVKLEPGEHTVKVVFRTSFIGLDKFVLTSDLHWFPAPEDQ
ncbi:MAG: hypothetical protein ACE15C_14425 [Phycisphaerae bacterium]